MPKMVLDCNELELRSPMITFRDEPVVKVGDIYAGWNGLMVVVGPATSGNPRHLWDAVILFPEGTA